MRTTQEREGSVSLALVVVIVLFLQSVAKGGKTRIRTKIDPLQLTLSPENIQSVTTVDGYCITIE